MKYIIWLILVLLGGCDQLKERAGLPDPVKIEAEGKALGSACRHAGWGPEDCYRLNPEASKPAMFAGWKEMNEYMIKNNMQPVAPTIPPPATEAEAAPKKSKKKMIDLDAVGDKKAHGEEGDAEDPAAGHAGKADAASDAKSDHAGSDTGKAKKDAEH